MQIAIKILQKFLKKSFFSFFFVSKWASVQNSMQKNQFEFPAIRRFFIFTDTFPLFSIADAHP